MVSTRLIPASLRTAASVVLTVAALLAVASCRKTDGRERAVRFGAVLEGRLEGVDTKASEVTSLPSFYVSAVTGTMGSDESPVWNSVPFMGGPVYTGGQTWPAEDPGWMFYGSNLMLSYSPEGASVRADAGMDAVCAVMPAPEYEGLNTLAFKHIFARLGNVSVSSTDSYTVTSVSVSVRPYVRGTYDLYKGNGKTDGTGWSKLIEGASVYVANSTPSTKSNDVWMVPGTYPFIVSWTASSGDYLQSFGPVAVSVPVSAGKVTDVNFMFGGDAEEILFNVNVREWGENVIDGGVVEAVHDPVVVYSFGGIEVTPGDLYYDGAAWSIDEAWDTHCTYKVAYGVTEGVASSYFSFIDMGQLFEKADFGKSDGDIENLLDPLGGWRMPTRDECMTLATTSTDVRPGSTVNGNPNCHWAFIQLAVDIIYAGVNGRKGLLVFPDDETITGKELSGFDNYSTITNSFSLSDIETYTSQGCVFFPTTGEAYYYSSLNNGWAAGGSGIYWTSESANTNSGYYFWFTQGNAINNYSISKDTYWYPVRLVRSIE